jgi:hypothetical protein
MHVTNPQPGQQVQQNFEATGGGAAKSTPVNGSIAGTQASGNSNDNGGWKLRFNNVSTGVHSLNVSCDNEQVTVNNVNVVAQGAS